MNFGVPYPQRCLSPPLAKGYRSLRLTAHRQRPVFATELVLSAPIDRFGGDNCIGSGCLQQRKADWQFSPMLGAERSAAARRAHLPLSQ